jgi:hypothetical protein
LSEEPAKLEEKYSVFLTGCDHVNLLMSEQKSLLGWVDKPRTLSEGDVVFVFDTSDHKIKSCLGILSPSNNTTPVWHEETSPPSKIIYPYRWDASLIADNLELTTEKIFEFEPFKNDKRRFSLIIRNGHPHSISNSQYDEFRHFLLDKIRLSFKQ